MDCIRKKVEEEVERGIAGPDHGCPYHPSHFIGQDCTFCFCPFYPCEDTKFGKFIGSRRGKQVWDCSDCLFIHRKEVVGFVMDEIRRSGFRDCGGERMAEIFSDAKEKFWRRGRPVMVLGATSDAGKSVTVAALCRILHRRGFVTAPFKSQNMSLNSKVTRTGSEIAMIQVLQAQAAGLKNTDYHMNPILMKPKGDMVSQVVVEGKPLGDYDVRSYYSEFVPGPGREAVKRNIDFLLDRYDIVVMEGAGSPAEINIYDSDIANMQAAEIADADCVLVVNAEWGGAFAYALGTVELIPEKDRKRIKGIIINNVRGDAEKMRPGAEELEKMLGIPVLGIVPHADVKLPSEDSESFRSSRTVGTGSVRVAVVKFPRISNFTDLDPLFLEDTTVVFADRPGELDGADAIVLPGTKNTISDLEWMRENGMAAKIVSMKGKVPIIGLCGGYQMMGSRLSDPNGIEGGRPSETDGLGLFNNATRWEVYDKCVRQVRGKTIATGGDVTGYEIHMGETDVKERPLFSLERFPGRVDEGSLREDEMLFGTYLHGVFDTQDFRRYFLSFVKGGTPVAESVDYQEYVDLNLDKLADVFEEALDMEKVMGIIGAVR
ncbi:MAG: cobyric acid synthase [Candidatus Methanomethylophilaceae archaeon]|jgi:adenosylcobyric acid synthase|nr:cobyric acid synthase [Candidatus Methanomethylophilaceae archaeon]NCA73463.1 cobyric acid synthase [Gammaproteobacteria bacterium]MDD3351178.1 cobyric acid synthase [Candidatus Methanomethylophilaceae archaeon]MDD3986226.1 cobyric acid synthase [Candidatus Methanomethylophilaceae archaeon]MDD4709064.1 cobyric acid synthase [Candidatus Methanomethylophilaceae archaeon]